MKFKQVTVFCVQPDMRWRAEAQAPGALFTWVSRFVGWDKFGSAVLEYIVGTAGRIRISDAQFVVDALNEYSLTIGESK